MRAVLSICRASAPVYGWVRPVAPQVRQGKTRHPNFEIRNKSQSAENQGNGEENGASPLLFSHLFRFRNYFEFRCSDFGFFVPESPLAAAGIATVALPFRNCLFGCALFVRGQGAANIDDRFKLATGISADESFVAFGRFDQFTFAGASFLRWHGLFVVVTVSHTAPQTAGTLQNALSARHSARIHRLITARPPAMPIVLQQLTWPFPPPPRMYQAKEPRPGR